MLNLELFNLVSTFFTNIRFMPANVLSIISLGSQMSLGAISSLNIGIFFLWYLGCVWERSKWKNILYWHTQNLGYKLPSVIGSVIKIQKYYSVYKNPPGCKCSFLCVLHWPVFALMRLLHTKTSVHCISILAHCYHIINTMICSTPLFILILLSDIVCCP